MGLILADLVINLGLGIYYMQHRDTVMGAFMLQCPIAISPLIFILELICVYLYHRYYKSKKKPGSKEKSLPKETRLAGEEEFLKKHNIPKEDSMLQYM